MLVALPALLLAALVLRVAFVEAYATRDPRAAGRIWAGHPAVVLQSGLAEVGEAAAAGRQVAPALVDRLLAASADAPLAPEPFLVRGIQAQLAGNDAVEEQALLAARRRNSRAIAARYFLADHYLKMGQTRQGLAEISALSRLVPQSLPNIAPFLATYARSPGASPQVRAMIRRQPQLETMLLGALAGDAENLDLVLYLWSGSGGEEAKAWQGRLVNSLVEAGDYAKARSAWARFTGISAGNDQLFDPDFSMPALPPFGWTLVSGPSGVAEPEDGGRLRILYYGRENLVLASQLLTLPPRSYRLTMRISGSSRSTGSLAWMVRCMPSNDSIATLELGAGGSEPAERFAVPASGCAAQRLELTGTAPEFPQQMEIRIAQLRLTREAGH